MRASLSYSPCLYKHLDVYKRQALQRHDARSGGTGTYPFPAFPGQPGGLSPEYGLSLIHISFPGYRRSKAVDAPRHNEDVFVRIQFTGFIPDDGVITVLPHVVRNLLQEIPAQGLDILLPQVLYCLLYTSRCV